MTDQTASASTPPLPGTSARRSRTRPRRDEPATGSTGPRVAGMQRLLNDMGYADPALLEDGQMGEVTAAALGKAQADLGVAGEQGRLGPATRAALRARRDGATTVRRSRSRSATTPAGEPLEEKPQVDPALDAGLEAKLLGVGYSRERVAAILRRVTRR